MTLLEFVLTTECGPPVNKYWRCPAAEHHSTSVEVNKPKDGCKIKWRCHRCKAWGDEFDVLRLVYPNETYDVRLARVARHREQFEAGQAPGGAGDSFPMGSRRRAERDTRQVLQNAWTEFTWDENRLVDRAVAYTDAHVAAGGSRENFALPLELRGWGARLVAVANDYRVDAGDLARQCHEFMEWVRDSERAHFPDCDDAECNADLCRAARGLAPLTDAELPALQARLEVERQQADEERLARVIAPLPLRTRESLRRKADQYGAGYVLSDLSRRRAGPG